MPLLLDGRIDTGFIRERRLIKRLFRRSSGSAEVSKSIKIPEPVYKYAMKISQITGLPFEEVIRSAPVQRMIDRWSKYVEVSL